MKYTLLPRVVEARQWLWNTEQMHELKYWLSQAGVVFTLNAPQRLSFSNPRAPEIVPSLWLHDRRWDPYEVRHGDWLVLHGYGDVRVVPAKRFREEYEPEEEDEL